MVNTIRQCGSIGGRSFIWLVRSSLRTVVEIPGECRTTSSKSQYDCEISPIGICIISSSSRMVIW